jgi:hypothetical protein
MLVLSSTVASGYYNCYTDGSSSLGNYGYPPGMLISGYQNAGHNHYIKVANGSHGNVAQFKYFGTAVPNQNLIHQTKTICLVCCLKMKKLESMKL